MNSASADVGTECRVCHGNTNDRHHLLVTGKGYECLDCHDVLTETETFEVVVVRDCLVCHGMEVHPDSDGDGIFDDGDMSGVAGDWPCTAGAIDFCDDNCIDIYNPEQTDANANGIGDICETGGAWKGDMDQDGTVDIRDVILVLRMALDLDADDICADINDDGVVNIADVILTLRMALGLDGLQECI
jgi:hypothetical protein